MELSAWILAVQVASGTSQAAASACAMGHALGLTTGVVDTCLAEDDQRAGLAAPKESTDRTRLLESAARRYERAASAFVDQKVKKQVLEQLSRLFETSMLARADRLEPVLRQLITIDPADLTARFRLARLQEDQGFIDLAETTLVEARRASPDVLEPNRQLAQFYTRRVSALQPPRAPQSTTADGNRPRRDENGVLIAGQGVQPPQRLGVPLYPPDAKAAGIEGAVAIEILIGETGTVRDARIVRSVPLLDDAALAAVRDWTFTPTMVNGQAVPVKSTVTVNFTNR